MNKPLNTTNTDTTAALKVGFVFDDSLDSSDGVAQYVKVVGAWLTAGGHEVRYLVGQTKLEEWRGGKVYSLAYNLRVRWGGNRLSMPLTSSRRQIKRILVAEKFDVLHIQVPYSPLMAQLVIRAAGPQTAVVGTFHILPASRLAAAGTRLLRLFYGKNLKRFNLMFGVTTAAAKFARSALGVAVQVLPNVVELKRFQAASAKTQPDKDRIVFLGRLVPRKGAMELLKAFRLLHQDYPEARLTIAGDGPLRPKLEQFVKAEHLSQSVEFLGIIKESEKPTLLASAAIACFPSLYGESFGIVLIEAMAAGAGVVVGGDNPGYRSLLGAQPQLLIDPKDSQGLADRLELLLSDQFLAKRLHAWQTEFVKDFDIEVVGPQVVAAYRRAIAKKAQTRA